MKRLFFAHCLLLSLLLCLCACAGPAALPAEPPALPSPSAGPSPEPSAFAMPCPEPTTEDPSDHEEIVPEGLLALEFAENYPTIEYDEVRYGFIDSLADGKVTFKDLHWYTFEERQAWMEVGPGETPRVADPPNYELTGENLTYGVADDCQYWILWDNHWIRPARIGAADFDAYRAMTNWQMVFCMYVADDRVAMVCEQYVP